MTEMYSKNLKYYLKKFHVEEESRLSFEDKARLFIAAIKGFFETEVSIYELSNIGAALWSTLTNEEKGTVVGWQMHWAEESEFYLHHLSEIGPDGTRIHNSMGSIIGELEDLYRKNKESGYLGLEKDPNDVSE